MRWHLASSRYGPAGAAALLALVAACSGPPAAGGGDGGRAADLGEPACAPAAVLSFCQGPARFLWDPAAGELWSLPDDALTIPDQSTLTGRRLALTPERFPALAKVPEALQGVIEDLNTLDGFGTTAGAVLRFDAPVAPASVEDALAMVVLDGPSEIPFEVRRTDEDRTLIVEPMVPLPPSAQVAVAATRALATVDGGCFSPGHALRDELAAAACADQGAADGSAGGLARALTALAALGRVGRADELSALLVYTTQSIAGDSRAVAADIAGREPALDADPVCADEAAMRVCETSFSGWDHRRADGILDPADRGAAQREWSVPLTAYLPLAPGDYGGPPYPTLIYGHGLGGDRHQAHRLADFATPRGIAVAAIDAARHGDHPGGGASVSLLAIAEFFGVDVVAGSLRARVMRDNFRQSSYDKLQLVRLLTAAEIDADGDGEPDLDGARLAYLGVSLGGIMGPELLALTPAVGAAVLVAPGARVSTVIRDGEKFAPLVAALSPPGTTDGDVERFFPLLQTLLERADPANYAVGLLAADNGPSLLMGMVIDDSIVPNPSNRALARALGIPQVPPVLQEVGVIEVTGPAPIAGNLPSGRTAGLLQFDRVVGGGGAIEPATHNNIGDSSVGAAAWMHFLDTWLRTGTAEVIDPYAKLGIP